MRQIVITTTGDIDVLKVQENADPKPAAGEMLIRVKAAGLNFADILARQGLYPDSPPKPCVMGYEVSGIDSMGKPVVALTRFNGQSELVCVNANQIFPKPERLTFEEASAIPVNHLTAYALIVVMGSLHEGESVLIHNAGGGVGLAALDIAKKIGATTFGTASPSKHKFLIERGLDHPIDYRSQPWLPVLKDLTEGKGVDLILDPIGGSHWRKSYSALRHTGRLGMFGVSAASATGVRGKLKLLKAAVQTPWFQPFAMLNKNRGVFGLNLGHLWHEPEKVAQWMKAIIRGVEEGWINPYVDRAFRFEEAGAAHQYLEQRKNIGKVVLVP
jgi:NADPH:quinone reductase-like Zn-dependent oxidoreductase